MPLENLKTVSAETDSCETVQPQTLGATRHLPLQSIKGYAKNARTHSDKQIDLIARSIREFGFVNPVLIDRDKIIIAGHGRFEAALRLGLKTVPTVQLDHLSEAQVRAYRIADNRIAELSDWDEDVLRFEIGELADLDLGGALDLISALPGLIRLNLI